MTLSQQIAWDDTILPFQLDASDTRGRIARLDGVLEQILDQHDYPEKIEALVAEMALLTALIGQTIKLRWKLSLQVRTEGAVRMIATDYYGPQNESDPARIRAFASFDPDAITDDTAFDQLGKGYFAIMIDQGQGTTPYQGITPIAGGSLSACAETYFAQSEQLPTKFYLHFGKSILSGQGEHWRAGGIMLQQMPKASPHAKDEGASGDDGLLSAQDILDEDEGENWSRVNILAETVEELELIGPSVQTTELLYRLFHEEQPRVFDPQPVRFGCTCSEQKVLDSLSTFPKEDLEDMITDEGKITADCQFCGAHYSFDPSVAGAGSSSND